jgi:hypothetical protein
MLLQVKMYRAVVPPRRLAMTIGTALVILAVLYLIDKYGLWKRAAAICGIVLSVSAVGVGFYYGYQKWQERKAQAALESQWSPVPEPNDTSTGAVPRWDTLRPPKDYVLTDVSEAILYPVNADQDAKTAAWTWYHNSDCVSVGSPNGPPTHVLHGRELFNFASFDPRWMSGLALPPEVKKSLWNARVAECRLSPDQKDVKACLDKATGVIEVDAEWAQYLTSCGALRDMVYLSSRPGNASHKIK